MKRNWIDAYTLITASAANQLNAYAQADEPDQARGGRARDGRRRRHRPALDGDAGRSTGKRRPGTRPATRPARPSGGGTFRVLLRVPETEEQIAAQPHRPLHRRIPLVEGPGLTLGLAVNPATRRVDAHREPRSSLVAVAAGCASRQPPPQYVRADSADESAAAAGRHRGAEAASRCPDSSDACRSHESDSAPERAARASDVIDDANRKAALGPDREGYFNAIMTYDFAAGALYQVYAAPLQATAIQLQPGEKIVGKPAAGDTIRWVMGVGRSGRGGRRSSSTSTSSRRGPGSHTTIVINTDRRTYYLELHCFEDTYMAAVRWRYPQDELAQLEAVPRARTALVARHDGDERQPRRHQLLLSDQRREGQAGLDAGAGVRRRPEDVRPVPRRDAEPRGAGAVRPLDDERSPARELPRQERLLHRRPPDRSRRAPRRPEGPGDRPHRAAADGRDMRWTPPRGTPRLRASCGRPSAPRHAGRPTSTGPRSRPTIRACASIGRARARSARVRCCSSALLVGADRRWLHRRPAVAPRRIRSRRRTRDRDQTSRAAHLDPLPDVIKDARPRPP